MRIFIRHRFLNVTLDNAHYEIASKLLRPRACDRLLDVCWVRCSWAPDKLASESTDIGEDERRSDEMLSSKGEGGPCL